MSENVGRKLWIIFKISTYKKRQGILLSPPPQKLDHNLTGSGTDIGISPIIGDEACSAII